MSKGQRPAERENTRESRALRPFPGLVLAWWLLFIASGIVSNVVGRVVNATHGLSQTVAVDWVLVASHLLDILAAALAILVIRRLDARQETRRRALLRSVPAKAGSPAGPAFTG